MGADRDTDKAALGKHGRPQRKKESIRVRRESRRHLKRVDSGGGDHLQQRWREDLGLRCKFKVRDNIFFFLICTKSIEEGKKWDK